MITLKISRFRAITALCTASIVGAAAFTGCVGDDPSAGPGDESDGGSDGATTDGNVGDGSTGDSCTSTTTCGADTCVDLKTDSNHCGDCATVCKSAGGTSFACVQGTCGNKVVQVSAGSHQSCALLLDGSVWCWGSQASGQTGIISAGPTAVPQKIPVVTNITQIYSAAATQCALDASGDVWCWGDNSAGETGQPIGLDPGCAGTCNPTPKKVSLPGTEKGAQLSGSLETMCVRTVSKNVFCWGRNTSNLLNLGADVNQTSSTPVKIAVFASDVVDLDVGYANYGHPGIHAVGCAVRSDKTIWCWGSNVLGELGHGPSVGSPADITCSGTTDLYPCNATPQAVLDVDAGPFGNVSYARMRNMGGCLVRTDKTVWCWGDNADGELGVNTFENSAHPNPVAAMLDAGTEQIETADLTTWAVDGTGHVTGWGLDLEDVLGAGSYEVGYVIPTSLPLIGTVSQISAMEDHGMALRTDGTLVLWGLNYDSALGHGRGTNGDVVCPSDAPDAAPGCNPVPQILANPPWQ